MVTRRTLKIAEFNYGDLVEPFDPIDYGLTMAQEMIRGARNAREQYAISYRNIPFLVGAALLANNTETNQVGIFLGFNNTPFKGPKKFCAEMRATQTSKGYDQREMIVIAGTEDLDEIMGVNEHGLSTHTLPPCASCRHGHIDDASLVLTAGWQNDRIQAWTGKSVKAFFDRPVQQYDRRRNRRNAYTPPQQPELIDFSNDPLLYWALVHKEYREREADIRVDTEGELRLKRAEAAVDACYAAAA